MENKVKFYGVADLGAGGELKKAEKVLSLNLTNAYGNYSEINSIIELYNILLYIEKEIYLRSWSQEFKNQLPEKIKDIKKILGTYFNNIDEENLYDYAKQVNSIYIDDFLFLLTYYKVHKYFSNDVVELLLNIPNYHLYHLLRNRDLVAHLPEAIKRYILFEPDIIELYLQRYNTRKKSQEKYYFPKNISNSEMEELVIQYIQSSHPKVNVLNQLSQLSIQELHLSDDTKFLAKKRYEEQEKKLSENSHVFENKMGISFTTEVSESDLMDCNHDKSGFKIRYSIHWLKNNLDYPTILQNLIYVFGLVDYQFRFIAIHKKAEVETLERVFLSTAKNDYIENSTFQIQEDIQQSTIIMYAKFLESENITIESVIKWFFVSYLPEEFEVYGFEFKMPSTEITYEEKIRFMFAELDKLIKQFDIYQKYGHIDRELVQFTSNVPNYSEIKSLLPIKYIYLESQKMENILYSLFNNQSTLNLQFGGHDEVVFDKIIEGNLKMNEVKKWNKPIIEHLVENNILKIEDDHTLKFTSVGKIYLYKDLYENGFIHYYWLPDSWKEIIDEEIRNGNLKSDDNLLSQQESDYINYKFNKYKFVNGPNLRNKYLHGSNKPDDKEQHYYDYMTLIRILLLLTIKINDEFFLRNELNA